LLRGRHLLHAIDLSLTFDRYCRFSGRASRVVERVVHRRFRLRSTFRFLFVVRRCLAETKWSTTRLRSRVADEKFGMSAVQVSVVASGKVGEVLLNGNDVLLRRNAVGERVFPGTSLGRLANRHRALEGFIVESSRHLRD
jgi:hypothetical protein